VLICFRIMANQAETKGPWWVFVKGDHNLTIPNEESSFETQENLAREGFELVWDSAPSEFEGAKYASQNYGAHVPVPRTVTA
jgi:hypothetical protein